MSKVDFWGPHRSHGVFPLVYKCLSFGIAGRFAGVQLLAAADTSPTQP